MPSKLTRESLHVRGYGYVHGRGRVIPPHAMECVRAATKPTNPPNNNNGG